MANIMLTDVCNLNCSYCFANEFVNKDKNEITEKAFDRAVDFIVGDGTHESVGLIGGEPTIHSRFDHLLRKLIRDSRVKNVIIYTNGLEISRHWDIITHKKVHLLINCNPPTITGSLCFDTLRNNLDILIRKKEFKENVTLGINMFEAEFEYAYIIELLKRYDYHHVRVSITVPNIDGKRNIDAHDYFRSIKPRMLSFFRELFSNKIVPNFDCNKIPSCLIDPDEITEFRQYMSESDMSDKVKKSNVGDQCVRCVPVIDIRQDLTAVRCFGLSEYTKEDIRQFKTISDLENFYLRTIDAYVYNTSYSAKCNDCYKRYTAQCSGGCYAFKINEILEVKKYAEKRMTGMVGTEG